LSPAGQPGPPLGFGRSAEIYDLGHGRVLRRYHDRTRSAEREAKIISWAGDHGVPVPEVFDASGPDIVMEMVDGPTMLDLHPLNVLLSPRGPVLIDWEGAGRGPAEADLAVCWVTVALSSVPGSVWQRGIGRAGQRLFAAAVLRQAGLRVDGEWLAKAARFRLGDPHLLEAEAAWIRHMLASTQE
jgi:Phosphotransferase enzyme family